MGFLSVSVAEVLAHITEAVEKGAEIYNMGWYDSDDHIESKTDKGILITIRNADGSFYHEWHRYTDQEAA
jgi:hypothetical protein